MEVNLSLGDAFLAAFGYRTGAFEPEFKQIAGIDKNNRANFGNFGSKYFAVDVAGREFYMPITVSVSDEKIPGTDTSYRDRLGAKTDFANEYSWQLPHPVVKISSKKTIIETALTERAGTVSEYINTSNYNINIKGLIINQNNELPEEDMGILLRLYEMNIPIVMRGVLLDLVLNNPITGNTDGVIIKALTFPEVKGVKHVRAYELDCVSDSAFNLKEV